jgi:hypothetical protein
VNVNSGWLQYAEIITRSLNPLALTTQVGLVNFHSVSIPFPNVRVEITSPVSKRRMSRASQMAHSLILITLMESYNEEGFMADEKSRSQNQENDQDRGKAMSAGASAGYQGQQENEQQNLGGNAQQSETAGQGGGMQGTGQRQPNPGGYTGGNTGGDDRELRQRDEGRGNEALGQGRSGNE